jgi:rare lipoprotein A
MQRRVERALVAKVGAFVFAGALGLPVGLSPASAQASVMVADVVAAATTSTSLHLLAATIDLPELRLPPSSRGAALAVVAGFEEPSPSSAPASVETAGPAAVAPVFAAAAPSSAAPAIAQFPAPTFPPPEPLVTDGPVVASWYGPGFYGNRTACGHTYTPEILGVAHRLLPCGTPIRITSPTGVTLVVPVIDRGPYIAGRSLDLSNATKLALACTDLCRVHMTVMK